MKMQLRSLIIAFWLVLPLAASAEAPPEPGPGAPWGEHGQGHMQQRLDALHNELKLTEAQEPAWKTYVDKLRAAREEKKEARPDFEALKSMTAVERLEKGIELGKIRQAFMTDVLAATRTFYTGLAPEQKKTFDELSPFGARAPKWGHGRPHPGMK